MNNSVFNKDGIQIGDKTIFDMTCEEIKATAESYREGGDGHEGIKGTFIYEVIKITADNLGSTQIEIDAAILAFQAMIIHNKGKDMPNTLRMLVSFMKACREKKIILGQKPIMH